jgi:ABC-type sugar transport system ATPase subunit
VKDLPLPDSNLLIAFCFCGGACIVALSVGAVSVGENFIFEYDQKEIVVSGNIDEPKEQMIASALNGEITVSPHSILCKDTLLYNHNTPDDDRGRHYCNKHPYQSNQLVDSEHDIAQAKLYHCTLVLSGPFQVACIYNYVLFDKAEIRAKELLDIVNLNDAAHKKIGALSGGMRQRVGIAQQQGAEKLMFPLQHQRYRCNRQQPARKDIDIIKCKQSNRKRQ